MKILIITTFAVVFSFYSKAQNPIKGDSLIKYSYSITGLANSPKAAFGSCFFIKNKNELYLITAAHTFYKCDSLKNKVIRTAFFGLVLVPNSPQQFMQFEVPDRNTNCVRSDKDTDLFIIKIDNKWLPYVNTIEGFLLPEFKEPLGEIDIFGQGLIDSLGRYQQQNHIRIPQKSFQFYFNTPALDSIHIDSVHLFIESKKLTLGGWLQGFSGSPIFLQDYKTKKWRFCGLLIGAILESDGQPLQGIIAIKPKYILKAIDSSK